MYDCLPMQSSSLFLILFKLQMQEKVPQFRSELLLCMLYKPLSMIKKLSA
jgi:hypothetical protein